jgi:4-diphosphocytidyl-2-C-methyl-D-erythritol kinase
MRFSVEAPAKVNRELRVGLRRPDGYHPIFSRMVSIDLADRLEGEAAPIFEFACSDPALASHDSNLVVRAARALAERLGRRPSGRVRLVKRVPLGGGLGGGSADAAAALVLFSRMWDADLEESEALGLAASLGSDVPFFLTGGEADVSGRGERVDARSDEASADLLLLIPPFPLSTRDVYAAFDRIAPPTQELPPQLDVESSGNFFGPNDLASAVHAIERQMMAYLRSARELADEAGISGSGSAIVLRGATREAEGALRERHPETTTLKARTLGREEYRRRLFGPEGSPWRSPR